MDIIYGLLIIAGFQLWILFMDRFFKSCSHYGYIQFLKGTGLEIKPFQFIWTTTAFNKFFQKYGINKFLTLWFNFGLCGSLILLPFATILLLKAFFGNFSSESSESFIEPVLPGINLPASEIGYYSSTLLISSILHELGHALASSQEDVPLINVGTYIIFVLPVAYVNLNSDKLFSLNPWKRLKIMCAGVWHNLVITLIAYLFYFSVPTIFSPLFYHNEGVIVTDLSKKSPLLGEKGLHLNDIIYKINECDVIDENSWFKCLTSSKSTKPAFCIEADLIHNLDESIHLKHLDNGIVSCCRSDSKGKLCFEYLDSKDSILDMPPFTCLPGRIVIEKSKNFCTENPHFCPKDCFCFRPILTNYTNLFKIKRKDQNDVIYIGPVSDFVKTLTVSQYVPKFSFLSTSIPDVTTKLFSYLVMFSFGLAVINILPCLGLDGQHIIHTLSLIVFSRHLRATHINVMSGIITAAFTFLLILHCLLVFWAKFQ